MNLTHLIRLMKEFHEATTDSAALATSFALTGNPRHFVEGLGNEAILFEKIENLFEAVVGRKPTLAEVTAITHMGN